jgi:trimethylamine--corrinoid protein Co-methyltransferase
MNRFVDDARIKDAHAQTLEIMETVGVRFENQEARELFMNHGARTEGDKVLISRRLLEEALSTTPKQDYNNTTTEKRVVASTPFGSAPFILDDDTGALRRCNMEDAIRFYQINETSPLYECTNPGCADPVDNNAPDQFVSQIAMALKYSCKYPSFGLRATTSTAMNGNVYASARRAFRMVREFYDIWDQPVLTQGICPNPPLAYDWECIDNLCAAVDEQQTISLMPCSLGFMTAPESIMGVVIHDFAMALAGLVFIQLKSPGHPISFSDFSTISNIRTLQPNYGSVESVYIQVIFYELCKSLGIPCSISGGYGDGTKVDYQAGMEAMLTTTLPFSLTEITEVWCTPGILAGFACGSFQKAILDEEMMRYANRMLRGTELMIDEKLPKMLSAGLDAGGFLGIGRMKTYNRDNYMTNVFNKWGIGKAENPQKSDLSFIARQMLESRIASYVLPERSDAKKKILQPHLPSQCRY